MELWGEIVVDDWGKLGTRSKAGIYYWHSKRRNLLNEDTFYSSVIFSANKTERTPTTIAKRYEALYLFIKDKPQVLGTRCAEVFNKRLPFQVVLRSLGKAMPLISHPSKDHAARLHSLYPERYLSDEHKPKLVIGKENLEMLAGFRPKEEIFVFLKALPELYIVIPYDTIQDYLHSKGKKMHLKRMMYRLMSATYEEMKLSLDIFFDRMNRADETERESCLYQLLSRLHDQHPYDPGVYAPYFLNHFFMTPPNIAIFLPPGTLHSFLGGDFFEVSTSSENEVKVAFTTLDKGVDEFMAITDFSPIDFESFFFQPTVVDQYVKSFTPPVKEFGVIRIFIQEKIDYTINGRESCSMIFVIRGSARLEDSGIIKLGTTLFVFPYQSITFKVNKDITIFVVYPNPDIDMGPLDLLTY